MEGLKQKLRRFLSSLFEFAVGEEALDDDLPFLHRRLSAHAKEYRIIGEPKILKLE